MRRPPLTLKGSFERTALKGTVTVRVSEWQRRGSCRVRARGVNASG